MSCLAILPAPTDDMPPAVTARVHARANRTAARRAIEVLACGESLSGVMPVRSEIVITVATRDIITSGGSEDHQAQKCSSNRGLRHHSHLRFFLSLRTISKNSAMLLVPRGACEYNIFDGDFYQRLCLARVWQQIDPCIVR